MLDFYTVSSFFYKKSKQARIPTFVWLFRDDATAAKGSGCDEGTKARIPTFVWLFRDDATAAKGPGCDEGTNLRLRDFVVVPLMPT